MNRQDHWNTVYKTKTFDAVSWYRPHLDRSLAMIDRVTSDRNAAILDIGGGASTLVDDLLAHGYHDISVLDLSADALGIARQRLGVEANTVRWLVADLLDASLQAARYHVWHDRAVFHFLTETDQRASYVRQLTRALKPGGYVVLATFGPDGPLKCSGLETVRYDVAGLMRELGEGFTLIDNTLESHETPFGTVQQFLYALFQRAPNQHGK